MTNILLHVVCIRCFERFFRGVNVKEGKLVAKRRAYLMEDLDLIGVDYLWQVITYSSSVSVLYSWAELF